MSRLNYRDLAWGLLTLAFAVGYYLVADGIPRSLLSDTVGPGGVPKLLALCIGGLAVLCVVRARGSRARSVEGGDVATWRPHVLALGMLAIGVAYLILVSYLGYALTLFLLIVAVAVYSGAKLSLQLVLIGAAGSAFFWLVFAKLFRTSLPSGFWGAWIG